MKQLHLDDRDVREVWQEFKRLWWEKAEGARPATARSVAFQAPTVPLSHVRWEALPLSRPLWPVASPPRVTPNGPRGPPCPSFGICLPHSCRLLPALPNMGIRFQLVQGERRIGQRGRVTGWHRRSDRPYFEG
jgi:hypothetical protein